MALLRRKACAIFAVLIALMPAARAVQANENLQLVEQEIKGGLLYNFLKYTLWPAESAQPSGSPITVCLFGGDPFDGHLQPMAGRTVNQRVIEVRRVDSVKGTEGCALLFIDARRRETWPDLQRSLAKKGILTVSDFDGFAASGGMIEFTRIENRIGVKINTDALATAHLEVQDRLLRLASAVKTGSSD